MIPLTNKPSQDSGRSLPLVVVLLFVAAAVLLLAVGHLALLGPLQRRRRPAPVRHHQTAAIRVCRSLSSLRVMSYFSMECQHKAIIRGLDLNYELDLRGERRGVCCLLSSGAGRRLFSATDTEEVGDGEGETDGSVQKESIMTIDKRMGLGCQKLVMK